MGDWTPPQVRAAAESIVAGMTVLLDVGMSVSELRNHTYSMVVKANGPGTIRGDLEDDVVFFLEQCIHLACVQHGTAYTSIV